MQSIVLWIYIALLLAGGLMGLIKGKSRVSLIMSAVFATALAACAIGVIPQRPVLHALFVALLIVFLMRVIKTRKFMPAGLMLALTAAAFGMILILPG